MATTRDRHELRTQGDTQAAEAAHAPDGGLASCPWLRLCATDDQRDMHARAPGAWQRTDSPAGPSHPAIAERWMPRNTWRPGQTQDLHTPMPRMVPPREVNPQGQDSIAMAESAMEHVERQMRNLRVLLGLPDTSDGPRAA